MSRSNTGSSSSKDSTTSLPIAKQRSISASIVERWKFENDRELSTGKYGYVAKVSHGRS